MGDVDQRTRTLAQANVELEERVTARTAELSDMRDTLADHVANLSRHLSVLYEVILLGGQSLDMTAMRDKALETVMAALHADGGFVILWDAVAGAGRVATPRAGAWPRRACPGGPVFQGVEALLRSVRYRRG